MNFLPTPVLGKPVPGVLDPTLVRGKLVNERGQFVKEPPPQLEKQPPPLTLGDERHSELLGAIKGLKVSQNVDQTTDALPSRRDWR